ncbi:MAG: type II toxin-antitoxin system HicB family antitoxin [Nanoarchaeota archaeon]|nr:type II toxin-antitoxin system HicB family antitoxin [Nanoarchaeota archaeon]
MEMKYHADIVINKEKLSTGKSFFVAHCVNLGIASQGSSTDEALENIKEAIELYLEEQEEDYEKLSLSKDPSIFSIIKIKK